MTFARLQLQFESIWHLLKSFYNITKTWKNKTNKCGWFIKKKDIKINKVWTILCLQNKNKTVSDKKMYNTLKADHKQQDKQGQN